MNWTVLVQTLWYGLADGAGYMILASGLLLTFGILRIFNMAHGELFMLGAMLTFSFIRFLGMPFLVAAPLAVALVAAFGIVINRVIIQPVIHVHEMIPLLSTLALSLILLNGGAEIWSYYAYSLPFPFSFALKVGGLTFSAITITVIVVGFATIGGLYLWLSRARFGKEMRATVQNLTGACLVGIDTKKIYDLTLVLASGLAAVGGLMSGLFRVAEVNMGQPVLVIGFATVIAAGMGNLLGAAAVGLLFGITENLFAVYGAPLYSKAVVYGIMMVILVVRPQGLFAAKGD
jgi:branched-subunit amino acid ABC-type transport system permease component